MKKKSLFIGLILITVAIFIISFKNSSNISADKKIEGCKCYANGGTHSPGATVCLGGFLARCIATSGVGDQARDCGWDYLKDADGNYRRCSQ